MKEELYVQCRLNQQLEDGSILIEVAYIPVYGAKKGNKVELKGESGLWNVIAVSDQPIPLSQIRSKQSSDRKQRQASDI